MTVHLIPPVRGRTPRPLTEAGDAGHAARPPRSPSSIRLRRAAAAALAVGSVSAGLLGAAVTATGGSAAPTAGFRDTILSGTRTPALRAGVSDWGGTYTTSSGERVRVVSSDAYAIDHSRNQRWAEFLSRLVHGSELSTVTLNLAPPAETGEVCGDIDALACYDPRTGDIYSPAEAVGNVSVEAILAHEYGHHVAAARSNAPWEAVDWGTKRWASYTNVCARTRAGELAPGDENRNYELNPGEAFAETYRLLNERRLGLAETGWFVVDDRFYPDARSLALVQQDVLAPWPGATPVSRAGRLARRSTRSVVESTPLDGQLTATFTGTTSARVELVVGGRVLAHRTAKRGSLSTTVCGTRTATFRVRTTTQATRYTIRISRP